MSRQDPNHDQANESFDRIATDLRELRVHAGDVSYAEIVRRIAQDRQARGISPAAARPARTTVYDAFRTGRSRINAQLVGEIARALGAGEDEVCAWEQRCLVARHGAVGEADTAEATDTQPGATNGWWVNHHNAARLALALACLAINFAGYAAVKLFDLPLYIDTIGTGVTAIVLGPWRGALVGVGTNVLGCMIHGPISLLFAPQSAALALIWGYGARRFKMTQSIGRYFRLNIYAALSHIVVAIPVILLFFDGGTGHASDTVARQILSLGAPLVVAVYVSHMLIALADVLLTGFIMLTLIGFIATKPPFRQQCLHLFPFLAPQNMVTFVRKFARKGTQATPSCGWGADTSVPMR